MIRLSAIGRIRIVLIACLLMALSLVGVFQDPFRTSTVELVTNGSFEDGMQGWELPPPPAILARGGVSIVSGVSNSSRSLRLIDTGDGWLQRLPLRDIYPDMRLDFYTYLNATPGEILPEALFHLYFFPNGKTSATYYVDITVTLLNSEDLAAVFEPNPGIDIGGIYLRYNREPVDSWIHISVDVSKLIERNFPDFLDPQVSRIMLDSAEGGKVYFDDISIKSTNCVYGYAQSDRLFWNYILNSTLTKQISQILSFSVLVGASATAFHWLWRKATMKGKQNRPRKMALKRKRRVSV